jgi:hypothetical protein
VLGTESFIQQNIEGKDEKIKGYAICIQLMFEE